MINLYRPRLLIVENEQLEDWLRGSNLLIFRARDLEEIEYQLAQENIDIIVAIIDKSFPQLPKLMQKLPSNISVIFVNQQKGDIPREWNIGELILAAGLAKEKLGDICFELQKIKAASKQVA